MHVVVNRSALMEVLGVASSVVPSRSTKDLLKCVRLSATDDGLLISATDLEIGVRGGIRQVEVKATGDCLIPADKLVQIARESIDETLTIEADGDKCHIRGTDSHFEIYTQDPMEFPPVPDLEDEADLEIEGEALHVLIERTVFSVAKENTRYAINGVLWEKEAKKLSLVATDGRRLAWSSGSATKTVGDEGRAIVPVKTVSVLQRILGNSEGPVAVRLTENQFVARAGEYVVGSALVEGHFPQYREVVPKDCDKKIEVNTEEFLSAVRRAALLTNEHSKGVRVRVAEGQLVLSSRAPEQGEATISMPIEYDGPALEIGFSPVFLSEALRVAGSPTVQLELKDADRPGLLRVGQGFLYVIMPVSLA